MILRISRPCYDKYHRCPGWAGGGMRHAKVQACDGGYITYPQEGDKLARTWKWRFNRCPKCRVLVLPYMVRWLDWRWYQWKVSSWLITARSGRRSWSPC